MLGDVGTGRVPTDDHFVRLHLFMQFEHVFGKLHVDGDFILTLVMRDGEAVGDFDVISSFLDAAEKSADDASRLFRSPLERVDDAEQHRGMHHHVGDQIHLGFLFTVFLKFKIYVTQA